MKVAAVIPAHNEEDTIRECVRALARQTYPVERVVVVNDDSTDGTATVLQKLQQKYAFLHVVEKRADSTMRAGAVNLGIAELSTASCDIVLVLDADAYPHSRVAEEAVAMFSADKPNTIGAICSTVKLRGSGILYRLQKLEYGSFNADRVITHQGVMIVHGLCGAYRLNALHDVGGYTPGHLLEDYDLTVRLKKAGWKTVFNPRMKSETPCVPTWRQLIRQRLRWFRGGVDIILQHGVNRHTWFDAFQHVLFILLLVAIGWVAGSAIAGEAQWSPRVSLHILPVTLFGIGFLDLMLRRRWIEGGDKTDTVIRSMIVPELLYAVFMSALKVASYFLALLRVAPRW